MGPKARFRTIIISLVLAPALLCQTLEPVLPFAFWEQASEPLYRILLTWQQAKGFEKELGFAPAATEPKVAIITVGPETRKAFGSPVPREHYITLLEELKEAGNPWLLSLISFPKLADAGRSSPEAEALDRQWADSMRSYHRYVGASTEVLAGVPAEEEARDSAYHDAYYRMLLSKDVIDPQALPQLLPQLPLKLDEAPDYLDAQRALGVAPSYSLLHRNYCLQTYFANADESLVIPNALVWTLAYSARLGLYTAGGAQWPRPNERLAMSFEGQHELAPKLCLSSPAWTTRAFREARGIATLELVDVLKKQLKDYKGRPQTLKKFVQERSVILADEGSMLRGPGPADGDDNNLSYDYELTARFLDELLNQTTISRWPLEAQWGFSFSPLILGLLMLLAASLLSLPRLLILLVATTLALFGYAAIMLYGFGSYLIPVQAIGSNILSLAGITCFWLLGRQRARRQEEQFSTKLRHRLNPCRTLPALNAAVSQTLRDYAPSMRFELSGYDEALFKLAEQAELAGDLIKALGASGLELEKALQAMPSYLGDSVASVPASALDRRSWFFGEAVLGEASQRSHTALLSYEGRPLARLALSYLCPAHEHGASQMIAASIPKDLALVCHRIEQANKQSLLTYDRLLQGIRVKLMSQFLPLALVKQFKEDLPQDHKLRKTLMPRPIRAALLQADIRGYSALAATRSPVQLVNLLQAYYRNVIEAAQQIAQVRMVGDSIFLFVEEQHPMRDDVSAMDLVFHIACLFIRETEKQNKLRPGDPPIGFGIGLHFGDVIAGSLSSESYIDYTAVGPHVNMVARVEEMTKSDKIKERIGVNGVLISEEARRELKYFAASGIRECRLEELGVRVRSFSDINRLHYLTQDKALEACKLTSLEQLLSESTTAAIKA